MLALLILCQTFPYSAAAMTVSPALLVATGKAFGPKIAIIEASLKWLKRIVNVYHNVILTKALTLKHKNNTLLSF
jgi:hypothetical protein